MSGGLDRLRDWDPVDLDGLAERLTLRRLTDEDRAEIEQAAVAAVRGARTARALGRGLGALLNALAARYGA